MIGYRFTIVLGNLLRKCFFNLGSAKNNNVLKLEGQSKIIKTLLRIGLGWVEASHVLVNLL